MGNMVDIAAYSRDGKLQLVAEVTRTKNPSPGWAAQMRRNLLAHRQVPDAPYFMLVLPTRLYLWRNPSLPDALPQWETDTSRLPAFLQVHGAPLSGTALEILITSWLAHLVRSPLTPADAGPEMAWLFQSGLYDAIHGGSVRSEVAA